MTAFILTWKEEVWPYRHLRRLIDIFQETGAVEVRWRIRAHRQAKPGNTVFLLKQGADPAAFSGMVRSSMSLRCALMPRIQGRHVCVHSCAFCT